MSLFALPRLQVAGHRPVALAGGATGQGDPRRVTPSACSLAYVVAAAVERLRTQVERVVKLDGDRGLLVGNHTWTAPVGVLDFLRDVGRHFVSRRSSGSASVHRDVSAEVRGRALSGGGLSCPPVCESCGY